MQVIRNSLIIYVPKIQEKFNAKDIVYDQSQNSDAVCYKLEIMTNGV